MINQRQTNAGAKWIASVSIIRRLAQVRLLFSREVAIGFLSLFWVQVAVAKPLVISGQIEGYEVRIGVPAPLRVTAVHVKEGDPVTKCQPLLELDGSDVQAKREGANMMLAALRKEREQIHSAIALLQKRDLSRAVEGLTTSGAQGKTLIDPSTPPSVVHSPLPTVQAAQSQVPNPLITIQQKNLDEGYLVQKSELEDGFAKQIKMLEVATKANEDAASKSYAAQRTALQEVEKAKLEASDKHSFFGFRLPRKLRDAKAQAITEVVKAKEAALTQAYEQGKEGLKRVAEAQRTAANEALVAKEQALTESYKAKRSAIEQVAASIDALKKTAAEQQTQIQTQLSSFQASILGLQAQPQKGIAGVVAASQTGVLQLQLESARTRLLAVDSEIARVKAGQLELEAKAKMLRVNSPIAGRCATCNVHVGELPIPGQSIITIIDPSRTYLRAYVPEDLLGGIKIGQRAQVRIDYKQAPALEATVTKIDEQASFTPENVSLPKDRVRQVFGVNLMLKDAGDYAKPGMSADATLDTD